MKMQECDLRCAALIEQLYVQNFHQWTTYSVDTCFIVPVSECSIPGHSKA